MTKHLLTGLYILLGSTFISFTINAEDTSGGISSSGVSSNNNASSNATSNNPVDISKDSWLKSVTPLLPDLICKGFENDPQLKKRLDEIKMTYEQCATKIPDSVSKCQQELYANIPDKINSENAGIWGKALGECIGKDFAMKYLIPKSQ
ncbi:hypothetical protein [Fluoribacter gormanii]|uniref:T2SS substrate NttA domain-containing protein n=1 Tax=Fluoribacter gormanii TaxID=464 RepID=A0A377GKA1_9GAMM|nr:hypothetical protein [Fluoribacter gormanii]KTD00808.1 hypothetical protein Lgor_2725 [Fluoribacter gormanii]SIQ78046.1 hypothetical protein SAMN05421777_10363 [Fluoribacter gormanii]STO24955.1 Uncharacterised protein [Fluoribacter gormanii]